MFSQGQWIFVGIFVIAFLAIMVFSYRKDRGLHRKHYKGSFYVLIGFLVFLALLFFIKYFLDF